MYKFASFCMLHIQNEKWLSCNSFRRIKTIIVDFYIGIGNVFFRPTGIDMRFLFCMEKGR